MFLTHDSIYHPTTNKNRKYIGHTQTQTHMNVHISSAKIKQMKQFTHDGIAAHTLHRTI